MEKTQTTSASHKDIEEILDSDVFCAICREVYINPIILNCSHSFCKFCLTFWLNKQVYCPSCRMVAVFQTENLALRNTISKMMTKTSSKYRKERNNLVQLRLEAEAKAQQEGLVPLREKKEAELEADIGHRLRHNRRRIRVIGQWKGPNGATIWRTNIVGDRVMCHDPEDTSESPEDGASDSESDVDIEFSDDDEQEASDVEEVDVRLAESPVDVEYFNQDESEENTSDSTTDTSDAMSESTSDSASDATFDYRAEIEQFDGHLPHEDDSDSDDSEFVAPEVTTSDEEEDDRMGDIDEETCEEEDSSGDEDEVMRHMVDSIYRDIIRPEVVDSSDSSVHTDEHVTDSDVQILDSDTDHDDDTDTDIGDYIASSFDW